MLSRRSNIRHYYADWTWSSHFNTSPQRLLVTRDMRLFVTRDLTFWHFDWHFDMCESDDMTSARAVKVGQSLSKIERPPIYELAYDNWRKIICHLRHLYVLITSGCFGSLKKEIGLSTTEKKSLEGTLSFSNWVLNNKQKCHGYCFIFKPPLYFICIKIILFCLCSQYLSSRSVTHDKSRA